MSLLTSSESTAFNGFLASVDGDDHADWHSISPHLADQIPHAEGTEALAKATKDLMSLDPRPASDPFFDVHPTSSSIPSSASTGSSWRGFAHGASTSQSKYVFHSGSTLPPPTGPASSSNNDQSGSSASHAQSLPDFHIFTSYARPQSQQSRYPHLPPLRSHAGSFTLPPLASTHGSSSSTHATAHEQPTLTTSSKSAPSLSHNASSASKRTLGSDPDASTASSSKRSKPSIDTTTIAKPAPPTRSASTSKTRSVSAAASGSAPAPSPAKPALLSPSQKRANHIQSEQKRRANIRRGYEALCEVVPPLREAIRLEELAAEAEREELAKSGKGRKRRKAGDEGEKADGRAGPKSENVVLQKTIDYINSLIADRQAMINRLETARNTLARGHPALTVAPAHMDEFNVPLWDRDWKGGTGLSDLMDEGGDGDGGGSDEEG